VASPWNSLTLYFIYIQSVFPFFDITHYLVWVMALKHQPGAATVAWKNPLSSCFTAMLHCFGGGIIRCVLLAEPPLRFLQITLICYEHLQSGILHFFPHAT
uniref:Uncharacterized protein n=1 Tax=Prolemur simus TaxID=1328070 RepID=A0A8C8ZQS1_PROSS